MTLPDNTEFGKLLSGMLAHRDALQALKRRAQATPGSGSTADETEVINGWMFMLTRQGVTWNLLATVAPSWREASIDDYLFLGYAIAALGVPQTEPIDAESEIMQWMWSDP